MYEASQTFLAGELGDRPFVVDTLEKAIYRNQPVERSTDQGEVDAPYSGLKEFRLVASAQKMVAAYRPYLGPFAYEPHQHCRRYPAFAAVAVKGSKSRPELAFEREVERRPRVLENMVMQEKVAQFLKPPGCPITFRSYARPRAAVGNHDRELISIHNGRDMELLSPVSSRCARAKSSGTPISMK